MDNDESIVGDGKFVRSFIKDDQQLMTALCHKITESSITSPQDAQIRQSILKILYRVKQLKSNEKIDKQIDETVTNHIVVLGVKKFLNQGKNRKSAIEEED